MLPNDPRVFNALVQFVNEWVGRWTRYKAHLSGVWANFFRYSTGLSVPPCLGVWPMMQRSPISLALPQREDRHVDRSARKSLV